MKMTPSITRRDFLKVAAIGSAAASVGLNGCATKAAEVAKIPIGLQLYSVRGDCKADFGGTMQKVSKIGYRGVEFAGYWGRSAKEIRKMLDGNGLVACGTHTAYETLLPDKIDETIEFNQVIGNKYLICPYMTAKTREEWLAHADMFNKLCEKVAPLGMWVGYHAHQHDFKKIGDEAAWDIFFGHTHAEVIMQLDTSNCRDGGADPVLVLNKYPGRVRSIHIKPNGGPAESIITEDKINWPGVFEYCEHRGNTKWYVVEHETSKTPMVAVERTFQKLKELGKV